METPEFTDPVVQGQDESNGEVVYTVRIRGTSFTPRIRKPGSYSVLAFDPDGDFRKVHTGMTSRKIRAP